MTLENICQWYNTCGLEETDCNSEDLLATKDVNASHGESLVDLQRPCMVLGINKEVRHEGFGECNSEEIEIGPSINIQASSFLAKLDDFVMILQDVGYNMEGYLINVEEINNHHGSNGRSP